METLNSGEFRILEGESEEPEYSGVELSLPLLDGICKDLFGGWVAPDSLSTTGNNICDVIRINDGTERIVRMWTNYETEADFVINNSSVKKWM